MSRPAQREGSPEQSGEIRNDLFRAFVMPGYSESLERFAALCRRCPALLIPARGSNEAAAACSAAAGFVLYPTVQRTTLLYDETACCFLKVLHPFGLRRVLLNRLSRRAARVARICGHLRGHGVPLPEIGAYGYLLSDRKPFFVMKQIPGRSLYDLAIRSSETVSPAVWRSAASLLSRVHSLGCWLGDSHLSHVFIDSEGVSGLIDPDSIRWLRPVLEARCRAKDLAGFLHPALGPETLDILLYSYVQESSLRNRDGFVVKVKRFADERWRR